MLSPLEFGLPSRRARRYNFLWLNEFFVFPAVGIRDVFGKTSALDASIYMVATEEQVHQMSSCMLEKQGLVFDIDNPPPQVACLPPALWTSLEGFLELAARRCISMHERVCIVNIAQTSEYMKAIDTRAMPALMATSSLFDMARGRLLVVMPESYFWCKVCLCHVHKCHKGCLAFPDRNFKQCTA